MILDKTSLMKTVDQVNDLLLAGEEIPTGEGLKAARWISSRQGSKGAYRTLYAPTEEDFQNGIHNFVGDKLTSASARHVLGQEAAVVVWLQGRQNSEIRSNYNRAIAWMRNHEGFQETGTFCCGRCTPAFWRHYWMGDFEHKEESLVRGLKALYNARDGKGRWGRYAFHYTLYALLDIDLEQAYQELKYARPAMERSIKVLRSDTFSNRRRMIMEKAMERVN